MEYPTSVSLGKVVTPNFLPQNERKRWMDNYLELLDQIG